MSFLTRSVVTVFAWSVLLFCVTNAHADSFQLSYSGLNISGSLTLNAKNNGNGTETVTSITGSQILNGVTRTVTGLVSPTGTPYSNFGNIFLYDDLLAPGSTPQIDFYGLLFGVNGLSQPVNICGNCQDNNPQDIYSEYVYVGTGGNSVNFGAAFQDYGITRLSLVQTPEPSTLLLLGFGIAAILLVARRKPTTHGVLHT